MNPKKTWKIAAACCIGGAFCALVAKSVAPAWWWIGLLAGFPTGYLAYEFKAVVTAVRKAMTELPGELRAYRQQQREFHAAHPLRRQLNMWRVVTTLVILAPSALLAVMGWSLQVLSDPTFTAVFFGLLFLIDALCFIFLVYRDLWRRQHGFKTHILCRTCVPAVTDANLLACHREFAVKFNPVSLFLLWPVYLFARYVVLGAPKWMPAVVLCLWRAGVKVFKAIHSDERLLCGTDSVIGGAIAYHLFDGILLAVLAGGAIGALLGVLNYELVSVRWLKLAPAQAK